MKSSEMIFIIKFEIKNLYIAHINFATLQNYLWSGINIVFSQVGFSEGFLSSIIDKIMNVFDEILALEAEAISKSVIIGWETQAYHLL